MIAVGESAGLGRRLGALFYDALLLAALLMIATVILLPLSHGEAITRETLGPFVFVAFQAYLVAVIVLYYGVCWTRTGQTLGMRTWKIRVLRTNGTRLRWRDVFVRMAAGALSWAALGLGYLWLFIDRETLTWHDRLSKTRVVRS